VGHEGKRDQVGRLSRGVHSEGSVCKGHESFSVGFFVVFVLFSVGRGEFVKCCVHSGGSQ
jgi:hypothetical protein